MVYQIDTLKTADVLPVSFNGPAFSVFHCRRVKTAVKLDFSKGYIDIHPAIPARFRAVFDGPRAREKDNKKPGDHAGN